MGSDDVQDARPLPGKSIIGGYTIRHEPRGDLGRFFLRADQLFLNAGIRLRSIDPIELVRINEANRETWLPLISTLDYREFPMGGDEFLAIAGYNQAGDAVATIATRRFDMRQSTLRNEAESLRLYHGAQAAEKRATTTLILTAPSGDSISGDVSYLGGLWIHPNARKLGITRLLPKLVRYLSYSQQPFDFEVGFAMANIAPGYVNIGYASQAVERGFSYEIKGAYAYDGVLAWLSRDYMLTTLAADVAEMEAASSLREIVGGQNVLALATAER
jgi:hypothetical protein